MERYNKYREVICGIQKVQGSQLNKWRDTISIGKSLEGYNKSRVVSGINGEIQ